MNRVLLAVTTSLALLAVAACASMGAGTLNTTPLTREGRIVTYKDSAGTCKTLTTPYIKATKANKDKVRWRIIDDYDCTEPEGVTVTIKFDKGDANPFTADCDLDDDNKIQCELRPDAVGGRLDYSVWIGSEQEDPEIEIEM